MLLHEITLYGGAFDGKVWRVAGSEDTLLIPRDKDGEEINDKKQKPVSWVEYTRQTDGKFLFSKVIRNS